MENKSNEPDNKSMESKKVVFEPTRIGPISTLEEMNTKVLKIQNERLAVKVQDMRRTATDLQNQIARLEKRQTQDDAVLNVINRYWNQLNEDVRLMLTRFDAESANDLETQNENEPGASFLMQVSTWDKEELDEKLANRVQVSKRAVSKIIHVYDRLLMKHEKLLHFVESIPSFNSNDKAFSMQEVKMEVDNDADKCKTESKPCVVDVKKEEKPDMINNEIKKEAGDIKPPLEIADHFKELYTNTFRENVRLQQMINQLHERHHNMSLKFKELQDTLNVRETDIAELQNRVDDIEYEKSKLQTKNCRIEHYLAETLEKVKILEQSVGDRGSSPTDNTSNDGVTKPNNLNNKKMEELIEELEEQRQVAASATESLETEKAKNIENLKKVVELEMKLKHLPESVVVETPEFKCLQSQYSVLYNDCIEMRTQLSEYKMNIQSLQSTYLRKIELMESEDLSTQKRLRTELLQMDDVNSQLRKEYEVLRLEFEQNLVANVQSGPINREMRHLIKSLQDHNTQMNLDVHRYRKKYRELSAELGKRKMSQSSKQNSESDVTHSDARDKKHDARNSKEESVEKKSETNDMEHNDTVQDSIDNSNDNDKSTTSQKDDQNNSDVSGSPPTKKLALGAPSSNSKPVASSSGDTPSNNKDGDGRRKEARDKDSKTDSDIVRDLKNQLKKSINEQKELKLLLDMHKGLNKEKRDKAQLMCIEKKLKTELEDLKQQMRRLQESKREGYKKLADEDALQKIKHLEEQNHTLQKQVHVHKQEEEALLSEMEVTGQAFEDMQEQNSRLIQQLREKDEANFKLMTERLKTNQLYKTSREESGMLQEKVNVCNKQLESMNLVVHKLEDKEKVYQTALNNLEKEMLLRQQAFELHKRKAIEHAQSAADLKLHLERYHAQMQEAQQIVTEKTGALEAESFKNSRLQEEIAQHKRKLERNKKIESAGTPNIVLMEEIKEYKETLTCPSCKVKRKDAVLTKCFHVFCWDCLKARYETRQRKCPKCNAAFGANDYHRLYLGN